MTSIDRTAPWHRRVVPVTGAALAAVVVAALLVPGFRDQLALSATHRPEPYVELYFARTQHPGIQQPCRTSGGRAQVRFTVASHLEDEQDLGYVVTVGNRRSRGSVSVLPGETARVTERVARPAGRYDVRVRLPGLGQRIEAHCGGGRR